MTLHLAPALLQHYILDTEPRSVAEVIAELDRSGSVARAQGSPVTPWSYFIWLERSALWALRGVQETSGLDEFLIVGRALSGVTDVAELLIPVLSDESGGDGGANSAEDFLGAAPAGEILSATFLWLDWECLVDGAGWGSAAAPSSAAILAAFRYLVGRMAVTLQEELGHPIPLLLCASTGDCDLVLYGLNADAGDLDRCLYRLNQISQVMLAEALGQPARSAEGAQAVVHRTRTELAVSAHLYQRFSGMDGPSDKAIALVNRTRGPQRLQPEIALARGAGAITNVHDRIGAVIGTEWRDQPVFGADDFVIRLAPQAATPAGEGNESTEDRESVCGLGDLLAVLGRLDAAHARDASFPRRQALRLGFSEPHGRAKANNPPQPPAPAPHRPSPDDATLEPWQRLIRSLSTLRWREDLRIVERVAERCITLQKSYGLPRETRDMLASAFERFGAMCRRIETMEQLALEIEQSSEAGREQVRKIVRDEFQLLRHELHLCGTSLDRVLSHHARGVTSLLLHSASQARAASHFASEIRLSLGHGMLFRAPATRLATRLAGLEGSEHHDWLPDLAVDLAKVSKPIIYASHDPDFSIRAGLALLRIPTWALWQPTTHVLHELSHTLAIVGPLQYLARKILARVGGGPVCPCPSFEKAVTALGLSVSDAGSWVVPGGLGEFAREFFRELPPAKPTGLPVPHAFHSHQLEEIAADTVERLLGYGPGEEGHRRHLWNSLPTLVPLAARNDVRAVRDRILVLYASQLAVRLVHASRAQRKPLLAVGGSSLAEAEAREHSADFLNWLHAWFEQKLAAPVEHVPPFVLTMIRDLHQQFVQPDLHVSLSAYIPFAHLIATVLSLPPVTETTYQSLFNATHVWGNLVALAEEADRAEEETKRLGEQIAEGIVPSAQCAFPERLLSHLSERFRQGTQCRFPPRASLALSLYLGSLWWQTSV